MRATHFQSTVIVPFPIRCGEFEKVPFPFWFYDVYSVERVQRDAAAAAVSKEKNLSDFCTLGETHFQQPRERQATKNSR